MDRAERAGWGAAVAGHVLVFGALSLGLVAVPKPVPPSTPAVDVQIVDEVALKDQVTNPAPAPPAPSVAPEVGPAVEAPPPPPEPVPAPKKSAALVPPVPTPAPVKAKAAPALKAVAAPTRPPAAKPVAKAPAKPVVARAILSRDTLAASPPARPHGARLGNDFLKGIGDRPSASTSAAPRGPVGAVATTSIGRLVREQLKPHWKAPTGADAELLRTELSISLGPDGSVREVHVIRTTGQTDSNRAQVKLHQEAAVKAVRLAAPFALPAELYDAWKLLEPVSFDKRLG